MARIMEKDKLVFGLDIGTRSIVGTVGYRENNRFHIVGQYAKEHETRAMLDGQIHDIYQVGNTIKEVKEKLESQLDVVLRTVCIAAAGRVLRTVTTSVTQEFGGDKEISSEDIYALDTLGVEKAYEEFVKNNESDLQFYCVGYTAMRYYLNGYVISNLEGHKGKSVSVDLIATFLPDDVVDGLYKAVEIAELEVVNLTLEPIAAIQVAIPEKFRMLNLALVDVGAGTSDISITKDGTVTAYGMIPVAGDSLTDIIVQHCLVEFKVAEQIKKQMTEMECITYEDILGLPQTITAEEVKMILSDAIKKMTTQVANCIKELNGDKPVSAVFVVGGGGMVLGYTEYLAEELGIPKERVAIRGEEVMQQIDFDIVEAKKDALMVTPIGICLSYYEQSNNFVFVNFNKERIKLYDNGQLSVVDAAIAAGFKNDDLFPKRGESIVFQINGKSRIARGYLGEAAIITLNGVESDIHSKIQNGDRIVVQSSTVGDAVKQSLEKLPELSEKMTVEIEGQRIQMPKTAFVNGELQIGSYEIKQDDNIEVRNWYTVEQIAEFLDITLDENTEIYVNDVIAKTDTKVYHEFSLSFKNKIASSHNKRDKIEELDSSIKFKHSSQSNDVNEEEISVTPVNINCYVLVNKKPIYMTGKSSYVFVDVFEYIDFDLKEKVGQTVVTLLNGKPAEYMKKLKDGDMIDIFWR